MPHLLELHVANGKERGLESDREDAFSSIVVIVIVVVIIALLVTKVIITTIIITAIIIVMILILVLIVVIMMAIMMVIMMVSVVLIVVIMMERERERETFKLTQNSEGALSIGVVYSTCKREGQSNLTESALYSTVAIHSSNRED